MTYKESQKFSKWLMLLLVPITVPLILTDFIYTYLSNEVFSLSNLLWTLPFSLVTIAIAILFWVLRLDTTVDETGVRYKFFPFTTTKHVPWTDIEYAYVRRYNPLSEYGGWGLRTGWSRKVGSAYNTKGDIGLQLVYKSGKRFLLGTQNQEQLKDYMQELYQKGLVKPETDNVSGINDRF